NVIQLDLMKYIREATSNNYYIVLLSDLNADIDNPKLHSQDKIFSPC
ncbi:12867_t:CDS:1, partial [Funneliformis geosporum]